MNDLHWTGAAVLLTLAVLGSGSRRPRRPEMLSWAEFLGEDSSAAAPHPVYLEPAGSAVLRARTGRAQGTLRSRAS